MCRGKRALFLSFERDVGVVEGAGAVPLSGGGDIDRASSKCLVSEGGWRWPQWRNGKQSRDTIRSLESKGRLPSRLSKPTAQAQWGPCQLLPGVNWKDISRSGAKRRIGENLTCVVGGIIWLLIWEKTERVKDEDRCGNCYSRLGESLWLTVFWLLQ